jgi:hypothetical protein
VYDKFVMKLLLSLFLKDNLPAVEQADQS